MANFWENDPVVNAPAGDVPAQPGPYRINIGKMPDNVARATLPGDGGVQTPTGIGPTPETIPADLTHDSDMGRAAAAGGATGPLYLAGAPVEVPTMVAKGLAAIPNLVGLDPQSKVYNAVDKVTPSVGQFTNYLRKEAGKVDTAIHNSIGNKGYESPLTYQPKDPREALAYNIASGATSNPVAPVAGALGGAGSSLAGDALKGTPLESIAPLIGGMAAASTPALAARYLPSTTAEGLIQKMTEGTTPEQWNQAQQIQQSGKSIGVPLTGAESIQQAHGMQGPLGTLQRVLENSPGSAPSFRPIIANRPDAITSAGKTMLNDTFGPLKSPETAATAGSKAATGAIEQATTTRTDAGQPYFESAQDQTASTLPALDALKKEVKAKIDKVGILTPAGKALTEFGNHLDQGKPVGPQPITVGGRVFQPDDPAYAKLVGAATQPAVSEGNAGVDAARGAAQDNASGQPLGPLMQSNRYFAKRLQQKYNPGLPSEQQTGYDNTTNAVLAPYNEKLTNILTRQSPEYGQGLNIHGEMSPEVSRLSNGPIGRIRDANAGTPGGNLASQASELLGPDARPAQIRQTIGDLVSGERANAEKVAVKDGFVKGSPQFQSAMAGFEPTAASQVVGTHLENMFNTATAKNQTGPNLFGGAKYATAVMGNPQMAENLQATVEALHGKQAWPGVAKFMQVIEATGKRKPTNSETQMNEEMQQAVNHTSGIVPTVARALDPFKALDMAGDAVDRLSARMNQKQLADVLTNPDSVQKMRQMAIWSANSRQARQLATQALQAAHMGDESNSAQQNSTRETSSQAPAAPAPQPQAQPAWMPPEGDQIYAPAAGGPVSALDRDSAIRTMYGEASGEGPDGQAAVAHVILNRARSGKFGGSVHDVVLAPHQFEPWNDPRERTRLQALRPDSPMYQQLGEIFDKASMGQLPDNTNGATHFVAAQLQRARGREMPEWARKEAQVAQIGGHTFYAP